MNERLFNKLSNIIDGRKKLAAHLGIAVTTIGNWKTRGTPPPTKYLQQIADFLGVSVDWLCTGKESDSGNSINVSNGVSNNSFFQSNNGYILIQNGQEHTLSDDVREILRIAEKLDIKRRHKLLNLAFELEDEIVAADERAG